MLCLTQHSIACPAFVSHISCPRQFQKRLPTLHRSPMLVLAEGCTSTMHSQMPLLHPCRPRVVSPLWHLAQQQCPLVQFLITNGCVQGFKTMPQLLLLLRYHHHQTTSGSVTNNSDAVVQDRNPQLLARHLCERPVKVCMFHTCDSLQLFPLFLPRCVSSVEAQACVKDRRMSSLHPFPLFCHVAVPVARSCSPRCRTATATAYSIATSSQKTW